MCWIISMKSKNSYKCDLTNSLVLLFMLSLNHQNQNNGLIGAMFLTISPFLVIDDNIIKASINLQKLINWTTYTCLDAYHHPCRLGPPPKTIISHFLLLLLATCLSYVDLIHSAFLPFWNILLLLGNMPCFDPHFSPFGVKSPKKALQNNRAQRKS